MNPIVDLEKLSYNNIQVGFWEKKNPMHLEECKVMGKGFV